MSELPESTIIEASAGTGKTHALAQRLIALVEAGVEPSRIVALTFSRAAAGEIFERFVTMLADGAEKNPHYAACLRRVIAQQHLSMIGTLDSFLLRIVRLFPLETGLESSVEIMPEFVRSSQAAKVSFSILRRTDSEAKKVFADAFARAMDGMNVRSFVEAFREFVKTWHESCLAHADDGAWGEAARIWPDGGFTPATVGDLAAAADAMLVFRPADKKWAELADFVRTFRGSFGQARGYLKKILELERIPSEGPIEFKFGRGKENNVFLNGDEANALRRGLAAVFGYAVRQKLELAKGIKRLITEYEKEYSRRVRSKGRLVFSDVPRLVGNLGEAKKLDIEYRLDSRIDAWALDEFQDTSREQWKALSNLIAESVQDQGRKSVFIVGDRKQAIYGWRNGDVEIFEREIASGQYAVGNLVKSYRFGPVVTEAINKVFASGRLAADFPDWKCPVHEAVHAERTGLVQKIEASSPGKESFVEPVYNALKAVDPCGRGISAAILTRGNAFGEYLASELKKRGLEGVVWEGESKAVDTPALNAFLDLVELADHPGDRKAYGHFSTTPLAKAKYPGGLPAAEVLSCEMAHEFAAKGLVRVLRELRAVLPEGSEEAWNASIEERFGEMLHAAGEFENVRDGSMGVSAFIKFLSSRTRRCVAEKGRIKVLTIHRSKGLGFDYVVLPLYEPKSLDAAKGSALSGDGWILPDPGSAVAKNVPVLAEAAARRDSREWLEALCVYYVAMTRAKRSMTIVLSPPSKSARRFSDYVRETLPDEIGDREWHLDMPPPGSGGCREREVPAPSVARAPREKTRRRLPSSLFRSGMSAGEFFAPDPKRLVAIRKGVAEHERLAAIEWWPDAPTEDLREAFTKPADFVELWREKPYEILADGVWESGVFDRVVFTKGGATVYDFKRARPKRGEGDAEFRARLDATYSGQLESYRNAVSRLSGLAPDRVSARIVPV